MGKFRDGTLLALKTTEQKYLSVQPSQILVLSSDSRETEHFTVKKVPGYKKTIVLRSALDSDIALDEKSNLTLYKDAWYKLAQQFKGNYFEVIKLDRNLFALRSYTEGRFLGVSQSGVVSLQKYCKENTHFTAEIIKAGPPKEKRASKLKIGKKYVIRSYKNNFINPTDDYKFELSNDESDRSSFVIEDAGSGKVYLRSILKGTYLTPNKDGSLVQESNSAEIESIEPVLTPHNKIAFRTSNGAFLSCKKEGSLFFNPIQKPTSQEEFEIMRTNK